MLKEIGGITFYSEEDKPTKGEWKDEGPYVGRVLLFALLASGVIWFCNQHFDAFIQVAQFISGK